MNMMQKISSEGLPSPKVQKLAEVLVDHFRKQLLIFVMGYIFCWVDFDDQSMNNADCPL